MSNRMSFKKMQEKPFKTYAPFGVATKRFNKVGFHPELDVSGAMKREITKTGPGSYNPQFYKCKPKRPTSSWKHKLELEEFSKYLGFRNANILARRNFEKTLRGPGSNDINENLFKKMDSSVLKNTGFGTGARFKSVSKYEQKPGPDAYFRKISQQFITKKPFSKVPTFEYDGLEDRFKSREPPYHLPCNIYDLKDGKNTVDITKKVVSVLKGPYDTFTGPRDDTTIKNYFNPMRSERPEYFYIKPSDVDFLLHHPSKKRTGVFFECTRFPNRPTVRHMLNDISLCYRDPDSPSPAHYDIACGIKTLGETPPPFGSSKANARPGGDWRIHPGPGRYSPKTPKCMKVKKATWVFLSKAPRTSPIKAYDEQYTII